MVIQWPLLRRKIKLNTEIQRGEFKKFLTPELTSELEAAREVVLQIAWKYVGLPTSRYLDPESGSTLETGFTCGGLILAILREAKNSLPHLVIPDGVVHASEMFDHLGVLVHSDLAKPGDLVFSCRPSGIKPTHVGLYLYNNRRGKPYMLSSSGHDGRIVGFAPIKEVDLQITGKPKQIYTHDPIGYKRLTLTMDNSRWPQIPIF